MQGADKGQAAPEVLEVGVNGLVASNVADMQSWLRLQAFLVALLPAVGAVAFRRWAHTFCSQMVLALSSSASIPSGAFQVTELPACLSMSSTTEAVRCTTEYRRSQLYAN